MTRSWRTVAGSLPITAHLDAIARGISEHSLSILEAPPGTGKTTVLPLALLDESWLDGRTILILQPRRIAARSVAARMSELLGEAVGGTVGYSVRLESKRSKHTRIEVITEGLLTRRLISDPELSGVGLVIFDEFHERSVHADISLALTLETLGVLRPDLKIAIMSATLGESLPAHYLSNAWRYEFAGTTFPVTTRYEPGDPRTPIWERAAGAIKSSLRRDEGDILAFLPGAFEIQRTQELLERSSLDAVITPLFGDLSYDEQSRAIHPDPKGRRKVVLATTIAETSLTIEGVRVVVDTGLHKVSRVDAGGNTTLSTEPISKDAADQRAGRAGRTAPGVCIRLWTEHDHLARRPFREPEILRSDLTSTLLDLAAWGITDPTSFAWVTPPPASALDPARRALVSLSALTPSGAITEKGKLLASLGAHPRLGALALEARSRGLEGLAAQIIALLEERDIFSGKHEGANILLRLEALNKAKGGSGAARRIFELSERWVDRIQALRVPRTTVSPAAHEEENVALLIALAFPERIARRRSDGSPRYLLASGKGGALKNGDPLMQSEYLATCTLHDGGDDIWIRLAAPLNPVLFRGALEQLVTTEKSASVDDRSGALTVQEQSKVGALVFSQRTHHRASPDEVAEAFSNWLRSPEGYSKITFGAAATALRERVAWAREHSPSTPLPDLSDKTLQSTVHEWLIPHLTHPPTLNSLSEHVVHQALEALLPWALRRELDEIAPTHITLPSGKSRSITYAAHAAPFFEARIQELFGLKETPRLGRLRIPATIHLLSPAHRPVQVTQDLASFWKNGYPEVRKELRGRYPKHKWPENPLEQTDRKN
jgi:ATP-dependent helicase HrpB